MKRADALLWMIAALLAAAAALTLVFAPRRSRHGYGAAREEAPEGAGVSSLGTGRAPGGGTTVTPRFPLPRGKG